MQNLRPTETGFTPAWSGQLDLAAPSLPDLLEDRDGSTFEHARILIRASGTPIGFLEVDTPGGRPELGHVVSSAKSDFGKIADRAADDDAWIQARGEMVSIVLCTRNRPDGVRRTLESLTSLKHENLELIVVDNAPADESTLATVRQFQQVDPRVRYVREPQPGLSRARNCGLREASGEYIAFTDDDVRVDPLWVNGLLRGFDRDERVACVTGLVASSSLRHPAEQYFDARVWWSSSCEPRLYTQERRLGDSALHPYAAGAFGTGANFAARTAVLRTLGGFDECLGAGSPTRGGEDLDIFVRLLLAGCALSYEPSALVWHDHRVDDASLRTQMYAYGIGLTAYLTKYLTAPATRMALARKSVVGALHAAMLMRRSRDASTDAALGREHLASVELRGMLVGPLAYVRARRLQAPEHLEMVAPSQIDTGRPDAQPVNAENLR